MKIKDILKNGNVIDIHKSITNLKMLYKESNEFQSGDKSNGANGWKIELDLNNDGNWEVFCLTGNEEAMNDQLETFYESCGGGISNSSITSQDYVISYEAYIARGRMSESLVHNKFDFKSRENIGVRTYDSLTNKFAQFKGIVTIGSIVRGPNALMKISGEIRIYEGTPVYLDIMDITRSAEGSVRYIDSTDSTISVKYSYDSNDDDISESSLELYEAEDDSVMIETLTPLVNGDDISFMFGEDPETILTPSTIYKVIVKSGTKELYSTLMYTKKA